MLSFLEIFTGISATEEAGVFIPVGDLVGMEALEIEGVGATLEGKLTYAFLNGLYFAITEVSPLGFPDSIKLDPFGVAPNTFTEGVTLNISRLIDLRDNSISQIPLAITGEHLGVGKLTLADCWASAAKLNGGANTTGAGVLIPNSWITAYGGIIPGTVDADARSYFAALMTAMNNTLPVRTATVASAITRKTDPKTVRVTGLSIPADYYQELNPKTAILAADLPYLRLIRETLSIEYEMAVSPSTQTLEINSRTA